LGSFCSLLKFPQTVNGFLIVIFITLLLK